MNPIVQISPISHPSASGQRLRRPLILATVFALGLAPLCAQTALLPALTNSAATNAPAAASPAAIALGDVVAQAQTTTSQLQKEKDSLDPDPVLQTVSDQLSDLTTQINDRSAEDKHMLETTISLSALQSSQAAWQSISDALASAQTSLSKRVTSLDNLQADLKKMDANWQATLSASTTTGNPALAQSIQDVRTQIAGTMKAVQAHQMPLYTMQNQVAAQDKITQAALEKVKKDIASGWTQLLQRNHPPLWDPQSFSRTAGVVSQEKASLSEQFTALQTYIGPRIGTALVQLLLMAMLVMGAYWIRNTMRARAQDEPDLQNAGQIFDLPVTTAILLTLLASWFLYPAAPRLLLALMGATTLVPAVIVTRRLIDPVNFPLLYATMIAYFVDQVRYVVTPAGILSRLLYIAELLAVLIFILTVFRSKHLCDSSSGESNRLKTLTRFYLHLTFFVLLAAGFANVFGYILLSIQVGNGMLDSSYLAVVLYAAVRIADALAISALSLPPLSGLGMVRRHKDLIYDNTTAVIRWAFFAAWAIVTLKLFVIYDPLLAAIDKLLTKDHSWGSLDFQVGPILAFPITIWVAFLISRLVRFALEEELYPHLQLGRGIPYATSTMVHYTILVLAFFVAVKAGGADLTQFSFLAGAFGVGLGFGLQNIFNNFISGIILLFERPIKVGDDIQIGTDMGRVERIGIRASVILLTNGSEMIVPNGNLISNPVTNWTLSNCERLIEIPVNVTSKVDPQHVLDLLIKAAQSHHNVLKNPAPRAYLVTFGAALNFRLQAWIDSEEEWMKITSDLSLAINAALAKENITIS